MKNCNFVNASKVEFTEIESAILNLGTKHVFRDTFGVPDLVSYFEKAAYLYQMKKDLKDKGKRERLWYKKGQSERKSLYMQRESKVIEKEMQ